MWLDFVIVSGFILIGVIWHIAITRRDIKALGKGALDSQFISKGLWGTHDRAAQRVWNRMMARGFAVFLGAFVVAFFLSLF